MPPGRLIAACLAVLAATLLGLGCGSGDATSADIDPQVATDLTGQLDRIQTFFDDGNCDRASGAVNTLRDAVDDVSDQTGEQFTADAQELVDNLAIRVDEDCEPDETTTRTTAETTDTIPETTDTIPETTDTVPETTETTTTKSTTTETTTTTPPPTGPPGNPGGPPGNPPGGGVIPGGGNDKRAGAGHGTGKPKSKHGDKGKHDHKERSR